MKTRCQNQNIPYNNKIPFQCQKTEAKSEIPWKREIYMLLGIVCLTLYGTNKEKKGFVEKDASFSKKSSARTKNTLKVIYQVKNLSVFG